MNPQAKPAPVLAASCQSAIVQRMGGIITLESDGVAGTTFFFDLEDAWTA